MAKRNIEDVERELAEAKRRLAEFGTADMVPIGPYVQKEGENDFGGGAQVLPAFILPGEDPTGGIELLDAMSPKQLRRRIIELEEELISMQAGRGE